LRPKKLDSLQVFPLQLELSAPIGNSSLFVMLQVVPIGIHCIALTLLGCQLALASLVSHNELLQQVLMAQAPDVICVAIVVLQVA